MHDGEVDRFLADRAWLFELSHDPMVVGRFDGTLSVVNGAYQRLVGLALDEILETPFLEVVHPDDREGVRVSLAQLAHGQSLHDYRLRLSGRLGQYRWVAWTLTPSPAEEVFYGVGRDVTERKEAEDSISRQAALLDLAHDAVVVRGPGGVIRYWNRGAEATYGWSREEALGRVMPELLYARYPEPLEDIEAAVATTGGWEGELCHRCRDGRELIVLSRWALRQEDPWDEPDMLEINRDITERKQAEEALAAQAQELSRSNADLEQFAYVASHDLQQPLRVIGSYAELLAMSESGSLSPEGAAAVERIRGGARHMQTLLRDLLAYCRVGRAELRRESIDCRELVDDVLANLEMLVSEADVVVEELPFVLGDRSQLGQVFQNLIANAVAFVRPDVRPEVIVSGSDRDGISLLCVTDNGIGIAPDQRKRIFDMFERVDGAADDTGTGIGLAICARVIERHGGHIWVDDAPGHGSRFCFTLPSS